MTASTLRQRAEQLAQDAEALEARIKGQQPVVIDGHCETVSPVAKAQCKALLANGLPEFILEDGATPLRPENHERVTELLELVFKGSRASCEHIIVQETFHGVIVTAFKVYASEAHQSADVSRLYPSCVVKLAEFGDSLRWFNNDKERFEIALTHGC